MAADRDPGGWRRGGSTTARGTAADATGPADSASATRRRLQSVDPAALEHLVADLWSAMGWETEVTPRSRDAGVDVVATRANPAFEQTLAIQVKRRRPGNPVGRPAVQQCRALAVPGAGADLALLVTTGRFTGVAREWADGNGVETADGEDLAALVAERGLHDVVARYAEGGGGRAGEDDVGGVGEDDVGRAGEGGRPPADRDGRAEGDDAAAGPRNTAGPDRHRPSAYRGALVLGLGVTKVAVLVAARTVRVVVLAAVALVAVLSGWLLCLSGVGEGAGLWLLGLLPRLVDGRERWTFDRPDTRGSRRTRVAYAAAVGWWLGLAVAAVAWALAVAGVGLPAARRLLGRLPTALRLSRGV